MLRVEHTKLAQLLVGSISVSTSLTLRIYKTINNQPGYTLHYILVINSLIR